jgi:hypothetical protein
MKMVEDRTSPVFCIMVQETVEPSCGVRTELPPLLDLGYELPRLDDGPLGGFGDKGCHEGGAQSLHHVGEGHDLLEIVPEIDHLADVEHGSSHSGSRVLPELSLIIAGSAAALTPGQISDLEAFNLSAYLYFLGTPGERLLISHSWRKLENAARSP